MTARADESAPFVMTNPHTYERAAGFQLTFGHYNDTSLIGIEGWMRWPIGHWSLSGRLPLLYARNDLFDGASLGNLTLEGTWAAASTRSRMYALDISLSLPTAADGGEGALASSSFAGFYIPDPGRYRPNTTTVRIHGTLRSRGPRYFGQVELGLHQLIIENADDWTLLRFGLGMGIRVSPNVMLIAELTTMSDVLDDVFGDDFWHSLDFGLRARTRGGHLGLRVYLPLDDYIRDAGAFGLMGSYEIFL